MKDLIAHIEGINVKTQNGLMKTQLIVGPVSLPLTQNIGKSMVLPHLLSTTSICWRLLQMHQSLHMVLSFVTMTLTTYS